MNNSLEKIRTLVVDDEPLARRWLKKLLALQPDFELVGEYGEGSSAVDAIQETRPDLLFLDVQMPGMDGFEVLCALGEEHLPATVFVTAYDRYAIEAFKVHALDYLLKPFGEERFKVALERIREAIRLKAQRAAASPLQDLLRELRDGQKNLEQALLHTKQPEPAQTLDRLVIKSAGRISFLKVKEISWIEAAGDYLELHHADGQSLIRGKISEIEKRLDPSQFQRIHRSTIVNLDHIKELQPLFHGDYQILLRGGSKVTLSRNYRDKLMSLLDQNG